MLERICLKAMERLIDDRFDSMHELAGALASYRGGASTPPAAAESVAAVARPARADPPWPAQHPDGAPEGR